MSTEALLFVWIEGGCLLGMPISKTQKDNILKDLEAKFAEATVTIFADYRGLKVSDATKLRRKLKGENCELKITKNTLTSIIVNRMGIEGMDEHLKGPMAIAFGKDPVAPAKILAEFIRENKIMEIKVGILEGKVIDAAGVNNLAELPSREVLLAKLLGGMQSPMYGFASVLQGNLRNFAYALEGLRKQRAGEA
jgi:large subunit ribosomal protein L10